MNRKRSDDIKDILDIQNGKKANKQHLCQTFGIDEKRPLFSFVGRLAFEKGADILPQICYKTLVKNEVSIIVLGSGVKEIESELKSLETPFKNSFVAYIGYNEDLAHQIYAASDFLLMPSRIEPCGLNQMYALRYGTIPIVRRTGGLANTVVDIGDGGFGICHDQASVEDVCYSINRALEFYKKKREFNKIRKKCMEIDHSWDKSAQEYLTLYKSISK